MRTNWQFWEGALSKEVCERYVSIVYETGDFEDATVFSTENQEYNPNNSVRSTRIAFVNVPEIVDCIRHYLVEANRNAYGFDVDWFPAIQFGEYSVGSFYNWHYDVNWESDSMYDRKLSIVIQLTDENEYEGGDFEFLEIQNPVGFRKQGSVLVFPSYNTHRVTEVTKGIRNSLVCWMEGPRWR